MASIEIYTTPTCPYCHAAKALLAEAGFHFLHQRFPAGVEVGFVLVLLGGGGVVQVVAHAWGWPSCSALCAARAAPSWTPAPASDFRISQYSTARRKCGITMLPPMMLAMANTS